ncbi:MAG: peptide deformylase [Omnitrophica bacterium RIFCSPLOWO2_01_FULL_45_10]|nr:MAG: peptide deformylase [Omnitrophica bacterium RIFCSPLOWO2_01_FULL_45_10]
MTELKILTFPTVILRKKASIVEGVSEEIRCLIADMAAVMYLNKGVGLAATQVGILKKVAVIDVGDGLVKLINPVIVKKEGLEIEEEGCLSVPDVHVKVKRAKRVTVSFLSDDWATQEVTAGGLFARAIQHELDHLSGRLILDYLNPLRKALLYLDVANMRYSSKGSKFSS